MSVEKVREYFEPFGLADRILEPEASSATVEEAARAVGCEPARIAKTMSFITADGPVLIVLAGDARTDNKKYKAAFGEKAKMIRPDEVEDLIGHAPGGVCPFAVKAGVTVYLDESLKRFETVYPAAGSSNSAIELTLPELEEYSHAAKWIDVGKDWE
ncbi:YbaK/EbsC family protein [Faecalicatena orotica]|uniref:Prolyl-tRNA editing enzyme YbaK/EbsC (Cys-tRNA(Pro) deacylase) n=1 Tax=Faecalicatena orotica TaxID=1544 RepID=A0A2Y9C4F4_9FIRM|nr:YbaK/EbsC family protein [Faecalicatena orotica]PWJ31150.1 prolyl-tRNA editing enzyme YbaK/EbsC (Cys-tRNA(Pro) deacylase) [Faecalicatena orotica]SSA54355.1 Cys-tRNA(Pro) deacylase, prolyl-tRNA editing enzyme YbaK/EbsC [Faecalicatena orotica]